MEEKKNLSSKGLLVAFFGPPASGKTRFSRILANLAEGYHVTVIETDSGQVLEYGDKNSPLKMKIICMTERNEEKL